MLLAAGEGKRLQPLTDKIPKCMIEVGGRPLLEHNIRWLRQFGVKEIVINLYHLPELVMRRFGDGSRWDARITYIVEPRLLGTAGAVKNVAHMFDRPFLVWYGDNISTCNLDRLWAAHRKRGGIATVALHRRDDVTQSGIAELDEDDRIIRFLEKPKPDQVFSNWVNAGIYALEIDMIDRIPSEGSPDFGRDIFPSLTNYQDAIYGYRMSGIEDIWWIDRFEDLGRARTSFRDSGIKS